jgi:hypothetical protein
VPVRSAIAPLLVASLLTLTSVRGALGAPACVTVPLYRSGFESGSGLADWTTVGLIGDASPSDWLGIQTCTAHGGEQIFRFGGASCDGSYTAGQRELAQPAGATGLAVPAGSSATRLSFWHRWAFETDHDGAFLAVKVDADPFYYLAMPAAILSGAAYNGQLADAAGCPPTPFLGVNVFTGTQSGLVETLVDLDAVCDVATGGSGGCAGHTIQAGFVAFTNCAVHDAGWFLDDVRVTTCAPPGPMGFFTLAPCRLLDTRNPQGPLGGPALGPAEERTFVLAGVCGLQEPVQSVSLNLTVTQTQGSGHLRLFAAGESAPETSAMNFVAGQTRANNTVLRLSADGLGRLVVRNDSAGQVDVIIDLNGYFE